MKNSFAFSASKTSLYNSFIALIIAQIQSGVSLCNFLHDQNSAAKTFKF